MSTATLTDAQLQRDVLDELKWEPSVDAAHIGVSVKEGIVTLTGHVSSYAEKYAAERAAKRVYGVKAVANELDVKLPGSSRRTDEDIAAAAVSALRSNLAVPADKIKVTVSSGWVTLEGEVEWQYQKMAAESAVRYLPGVVGLSNQHHGQAPRLAERAQVQDRGRTQCQRRDRCTPHQRRGRGQQGNPPRHRALVGREGRGRALPGQPGGHQRRKPDRRRTLMTPVRAAASAPITRDSNLEGADHERSISAVGLVAHPGEPGALPDRRRNGVGITGHVHVVRRGPVP